MRVHERSQRYFTVSEDRTGIPGLRTVSLTVRRDDGTAVDVECNSIHCERFRGAQLSALLRKMRCEGSRKIGLDFCWQRRLPGIATDQLQGTRKRRRRRRRSR
jgi:hypothetical protein